MLQLSAQLFPTGHRPAKVSVQSTLVHYLLENDENRLEISLILSTKATDKGLLAVLRQQPHSAILGNKIKEISNEFSFLEFARGLYLTIGVRKTIIVRNILKLWDVKLQF